MPYESPLARYSRNATCIEAMSPRACRAGFRSFERPRVKTPAPEPDFSLLRIVPAKAAGNLHRDSSGGGRSGRPADHRQHAHLRIAQPAAAVAARVAFPRGVDDFVRPHGREFLSGGLL